MANTSTGAGGSADERLEELRLALVLNGGVSLAVWMGGVSYELNRLVRETHPVYQGLLRLTKTAARIDVISGTSAGGLNGAALALAQIHDKSLYSLRNVWLDIGGLEDLMHEPEDEDLASLLRGNDWFLPKIQSAFEALTDPEPAPPSQVPMVLNLTTTLLDGQRHDRLDDFGANIEDVVHRASWRFERFEDAPGAVSGAASSAGAAASIADAFADQQIVARLAFAARSTASFPVAFEPAEYEPASSVFDGSDIFRIEGRKPGDEKTARLLLDGGILDNQPFEAALEGIAKLPANGDTRRVLAYIVPDPAAAAEVRKVGDDGKLVQPTLAQVAWRSLVSIPMSQSIGSHMDELKRHNADANARWQRIAGMVRHVSPEQLLDQANIMMPAYRARRIDGLIDYLLGAIEEGLLVDGARPKGVVGMKAVAGSKGDKGDKDAGEITDMRRSTRRWLRSVWQQASVAPPAGSAGVASSPAGPTSQTIAPSPAAVTTAHAASAASTAPAAPPPPSAPGTPAPPSAPAAPSSPAAPAPNSAQAPTRKISDFLKGRVPVDYAPTMPLVSKDDWPWGLFGLEFLADITLELLRRTQRLHAFVPRWEEDLRAAAKRGNAPPPPYASSITPAALDPDEVDEGENWEDRDKRRSQVGNALRTDVTRVGDKELQPIWQQVYVLARDVQQRRRHTQTSAQQTGAKEFKRLIANWRASDNNNQTKTDELRQQAVELMGTLLADPDPTGYVTRNAKEASALCNLVLQLERPMATILKCFDDKTSAGTVASGSGVTSFSTHSRADVQAAVDELRALHGFFFGPLTKDATDPADRIAWRALALEVFEFTAGARIDGPDSQSEVVQISARLPSIWDGSNNPSEKLNGMQLAHFGAFYRRSWRANDWTFGRLDGIDRAVRIALNPDSLQRRYGARLVEVPGQQLVKASQYVRDYLRKLAVDTAHGDLVEALNNDWDDNAILKELRWLDQDATVPPPVLEQCARALTRRLQLEALLAELPEIATSLRIEATLGAPPSKAGQSLLQRIPQGTAPSIKTVKELMRGNLIGSDNMTDQAGTDLFTRTASRGLSTAHAALSKNGGLHAIDIVFRITDWPLRVLYLLTNRMMQGGRTSAAFLGVCLGVGLALVAAGVIADKLPAIALTLGWALLAGVFAKALLGIPKERTKVALITAAAVVLVVVLALVLLNVLPLAFAAACAALAMLALQPRAPSLSTSAIVLVIAAWTVHAGIDDWQTELKSGFTTSADLASHVTAKQCAADASQTPQIDAERLKAACEHRAAMERIEMVRWPVLILIGGLLLAAVMRQSVRLWHSWRSIPKDSRPTIRRLVTWIREQI